MSFYRKELLKCQLLWGNAFQEVIFDVSINQTIQQSTEWKVNAETTAPQILAPNVEQRNQRTLRENICRKPENEKENGKIEALCYPGRERVKCKVKGFITTIRNKLQEVYFF